MENLAGAIRVYANPATEWFVFFEIGKMFCCGTFREGKEVAIFENEY